MGLMMMKKTFPILFQIWFLALIILVPLIAERPVRSWVVLLSLPLLWSPSVIAPHGLRGVSPLDREGPGRRGLLRRVLEGNQITTVKRILSHLPPEFQLKMGYDCTLRI